MPPHTAPARTRKRRTPFSGGGLEGQLLIASPLLNCTEFDHAVIFLCQHDPDGAMGLILNHPLEGLSLATVLKDMGSEDHGAQGLDIPVYAGGPVDRHQGFVLFSEDYAPDDAHIRVSLNASLSPNSGIGLGLSQSRAVLMDTSEGRGPHNLRLALGYSGWGPGQIEDEIRDNAWLIAPATLGLIFSIPPADLWPESLRAIGIRPGALSHQAGQA